MSLGHNSSLTRHFFVDFKISLIRFDVVLISLWEGMTDDTKCSIIHKYSEDEARRLQKEGELPTNFKLNLDDFDVEDEDDGFDMSDPSDSESESSEEEIDVDEI